MYLHFQKNNRTFEVQNETKQFNSNFLNQNIPRRSGASPATSDYSARSAATWALFSTFNLMQNEKNIHPSHHAPQSIQSHKTVLRVTKVECEGPDQFAIHVKVNNRGTIVIRCWDPDILERVLESLAKANQ
jgi:hypothetical protein